MSREKRNLYEGIYLLRASLSEEARNRCIKKITDDIEAHGGKVHQAHDWGRRKLAYPINKQRESYYYIIYFEVVTDAITDMHRQYRLNEDLLRYLTLKTKKVEEKIEFKSLARQ